MNTANVSQSTRGLPDSAQGAATDRHTSAVSSSPIQWPSRVDRLDHRVQKTPIIERCPPESDDRSVAVHAQYRYCPTRVARREPSLPSCHTRATTRVSHGHEPCDGGSIGDGLFQSHPRSAKCIHGSSYAGVWCSTYVTSNSGSVK